VKVPEAQKMTQAVGMAKTTEATEMLEVVELGAA